MRRCVFVATASIALSSLAWSAAHANDPVAVERASSTADIFKGETHDPYQLAMRAYVWGYPLVRAAQIRAYKTIPADPFRMRPPSVAGAAINRIGHARELATPEMREGVAPNNDTLYSLAWLDMSSGPFVFETPDFGQRYYTFQFGQADSSTDAALGQRTHGRKLPPIFIQGPNDHFPVPPGMVGVRSSQRYLMIAGRTLVDGLADIPAVHALQDKIRLRSWSDFAAGRDVLPPVTVQRPLLAADSDAPPAFQFLEMLGNVLRDWRISPREAALVDSFEKIGLSVRDGFQPERLSEASRKAIVRGVVVGEAAVRDKTFRLGLNIHGWTFNYKGSVFNGDYLLRAAVAMDQIYVLPAAEALYPNARTDGLGRELDGRNSYVLRFVHDRRPPVDAFWSVTMYFAEGLMVPNDINRYSIGDRTPGLIYGPDGSLEILLQHDRPSDLSSVNWLPAPQGKFMLMMRLYRPRPTVTDAMWAPPAIDRVSPR